MSDIKNVLLIGAGGNLGPSILNAFLNESSFTITILSREGSSSTFPSGVDVKNADYSSVDSLTTAFQGQDAVISIVGSAAIAEQQKVVDAAIAAGVKRYIPSEFGSNTADPRVLELVPIFGGKVGTVKYLRSKEDVISWTSVITGPFFDWGLKVGFLGFIAPAKTAHLIEGGDVPFTVTNLRQIGRALIKILEKPEVTKNQYVYISSFTTTGNDILATAEKISGEKWKTTDTPASSLLQAGGEKLKKGDFSGVADLIKGSVFTEGKGDLRPAGLWNEKLGLEQEDYEESVKAAIGGKLYGEK